MINKMIMNVELILAAKEYGEAFERCWEICDNHFKPKPACEETFYDNITNAIDVLSTKYKNFEEELKNLLRQSNYGSSGHDAILADLRTLIPGRVFRSFLTDNSLEGAVMHAARNARHDAVNVIRLVTEMHHAVQWYYDNGLWDPGFNYSTLNLLEEQQGTEPLPTVNTAEAVKSISKYDEMDEKTEIQCIEPTAITAHATGDEAEDEAMNAEGRCSYALTNLGYATLFDVMRRKGIIRTLPNNQLKNILPVLFGCSGEQVRQKFGEVNRESNNSKGEIIDMLNALIKELEK